VEKKSIAKWSLSATKKVPEPWRGSVAPDRRRLRFSNSSNVELVHRIHAANASCDNEKIERRRKKNTSWARLPFIPIGIRDDEAKHQSTHLAPLDLSHTVR
jgi:hypothetical protein